MLTNHCLNSQERSLTHVLNNSVSLSNLDISPPGHHSSTNLLNSDKSKEFSTPVKSVSQPAVLQTPSTKSKSSTPTGVELIIENSHPDPV